MGTHEGGTPERPALFFDGVNDFTDWLSEHHETATELWMGLYKKGAPRVGLTWDDAVPVALCFGWIDSVAQRIDADSRRQRWTPRKRDSVWSNVNIAHVERLSAAGLMRPAGVAAFERRTVSGVYSFEVDGELVLPPSYAAQLAADADAHALFFDVASPSYRRSAIHWVLSAKQETTRDRRMAQLVEACHAHTVAPPFRYGDLPGWARTDSSGRGPGPSEGRAQTRS